MNVDYTYNQILNPTIQSVEDVANYNQFALLGICIDNDGTAITVGKDLLYLLGTQGIQGMQGPAGSGGGGGGQGKPGPQGVQGLQGTRGSTGSSGSRGLQGYTGLQGATGSDAITHAGALELLGTMLYLDLPKYATIDCFNLSRVTYSSDNALSFGFYSNLTQHPVETGYLHHVLFRNNTNHIVYLRPIPDVNNTIPFYISSNIEFIQPDHSARIRFLNVPSGYDAYMTYFATKDDLTNSLVAHINVEVSKWASTVENES